MRKKYRSLERNTEKSKDLKEKLETWDIKGEGLK
jgi:hypothetical protein